MVSKLTCSRVLRTSISSLVLPMPVLPSMTMAPPVAMPLTMLVARCRMKPISASRPTNGRSGGPVCRLSPGPWLPFCCISLLVLGAPPPAVLSNGSTRYTMTGIFLPFTDNGSSSSYLALYLALENVGSSHRMSPMPPLHFIMSRADRLMASPKTVYSERILRAPTHVHRRSPVVTPTQMRCPPSLMRFMSSSAARMPREALSSCVWPGRPKAQMPTKPFSSQRNCMKEPSHLCITSCTLCTMNCTAATCSE
mmetsp:Transcript_4236/g.11434  ORF Transcript_4236/g.11434 Transcript_4236/m.11434 type:complete len:252 (-) Transcript_4236:2856-3611(-)